MTKKLSNHSCFIIFFWFGISIYSTFSQTTISYPALNYFDTIPGTVSESNVKSFIPKIELYKVENTTIEIDEDLEIINYNELNNFPANTVFDFKKDKNGFLWLGTNKGLIKFDGNNFYKIELPDSLNNIQVRSIAIDQNNNIWFNVYEKALLKYDGKNIKNMSFIAVDVKIRDLFISSYKTLWMVCDNGFAKLNNNHFSKYHFNKLFCCI